MMYVTCQAGRSQILLPSPASPNYCVRSNMTGSAPRDSSAKTTEGVTSAVRQRSARGHVDGEVVAPGRRGGRPSRRDELLTAALELFATGGTRGTSLEAIAKQIGVTRAAITHHFKTKE